MAQNETMTMYVTKVLVAKHSRVEKKVFEINEQILLLQSELDAQKKILSLYSDAHTTISGQLSELQKGPTNNDKNPTNNPPVP